MKADNLMMFILACVVFACVVAESGIALYQGWACGVVGYAVIAGFLLLTGGMVRLTWKELREEEG